MPISPALVRVPIGDVTYGRPIAPPLHAISNALMHQWYRTRAVVWQFNPPVAFLLTATTVTPWRWRMHTPAGLTDFALVVRGQAATAGVATVELLRDGTSVATVTMGSAPSVVSDLTGDVGTEGDHVWTVRLTRNAAATMTITDIWIVWADVATP